MMEIQSCLETPEGVESLPVCPKQSFTKDELQPINI
jgi:hypothetical protein